MNLALESGNLWTSLKIPFIGIMGDAPYQAPNLHSASGPGKFFLYGVKEFVDFYAHFMGGKNFATVLLPGYPSNPHASAIPWHKRDLELVFVKTGADPQAMRAGWANLPKLIQDVVEQASQTALAGQKDTIGQIVADAFAERQVHFGNRLAPFMRSCWLVDSYVRAFRADRMARQVMRHGVERPFVTRRDADINGAIRHAIARFGFAGGGRRSVGFQGLGSFGGVSELSVWRCPVEQGEMAAESRPGGFELTQRRRERCNLGVEDVEDWFGHGWQTPLSRRIFSEMGCGDSG